MPQPPVTATEDAITAGPLPHGGGGIRFGAGASNAYAGEVGYDTASATAAEYDTELVDEEQEEDVDDNDGGMQGGSHPSTLQRQMVSTSFEHAVPSLNSSQAACIKNQDLIYRCFVYYS